MVKVNNKNTRTTACFYIIYAKTTWNGIRIKNIFKKHKYASLIAPKSGISDPTPPPLGGFGYY